MTNWLASFWGHLIGHHTTWQGTHWSADLWFAGLRKISSNYQWFNKFDLFKTYPFEVNQPGVSAKSYPDDCYHFASRIATAICKQDHCLLVSTSTSAADIFHDTALLHMTARCICWKRYRPRGTSRKKWCSAVCGRKGEYLQPSNGWFCDVSGMEACEATYLQAT